MRKICILLPDLRGGGAERLNILLANYWHSSGIKVEVVLMKKQGRLINLLSPKISIIDLDTKKIRNTIPRIVKYLKQSRPDVVLSAMWPLTSAAIIAWLFSGKIGKLFTSDHIMLSIECMKNIVIPLPLLAFSLKTTYRYADGIIAVSLGVKKDLCNISGLSENKVKVIYNPVSQAREIPYISISERKKLWGSDFCYNILAVGSLKLQKDYETLLKAFSLMSSDISAKLVILGDGPLRTDIEKIILQLGLQKKVVLHGFCLDPYPWYLTADLFVLSSQWEGFGNVIVEALECGTPIVSTNCPSGPSEILENGKYGTLVPVGDYIKLSNAMAGSLKQEHDKFLLRKRADDFSVSRISDQYLDYFKLSQDV